jgi:hypothetical protein
MRITKIAGAMSLAAVFMTNLLFAQNDIEIEIFHKLNGAEFGFGDEAATPEDIPFELERMEYYISEISVQHDGGLVTDFEDVWALVQAGSSSTIIDLGSDLIEAVESVSFSIGVDAAHNHLDHTLYSSSHPLGPKSPSMHWGWTAGYRFVAMEGDAGEDLDQTFEIHALGDQNYFETTTEISVSASNGIVSIPIYANYAEALRGIDVEDGVITHGDYAEAVDLLENFQEYVFTAVEPVDSIPEDTTTGIGLIKASTMIGAERNPSLNSSVTLTFDPTLIDRNSIFMVDLTGKLIQSSNSDMGRVFFNGLATGVYGIRANSLDGSQVTSEKIIVLE